LTVESHPGVECLIKCVKLQPYGIGNSLGRALSTEGLSVRIPDGKQMRVVN